jgi:hypothetical protein
MTIVIWMLDNIFLFATSMSHRFMEDVIDVGTLPSWILKHMDYLSSTSTCYSNYNNVNCFHLKILLILTTSVMFMIIGHDTSKPLDI